MIKVLVTGVNGFIGAEYARHLRRTGHYIIGVDIHHADSFQLCDEYYSIDLGSHQARAAIQALPTPDLILHAGGISGFMVETDNAARIADVNIFGTLQLLELARRTKCRRTVLCSTTMVYGPRAFAAGEHDEAEYPEPISVYGASKVAVEALMHAFRGQYGVDAIALRFGHVYGPGRTTECFIREMLAAAAEQRPCHIPQVSTSLRQYVHIDDVCRSIMIAMEVEAPRSRVFNIAAGEIHTLGEVADVVQRLVGPLEVRFDAQRDLPNYRIEKMSIRRACEELGYSPRLPLVAGIERYWTSSFAQKDDVAPRRSSKNA
jgi:nucleoside-diphosphate-sugar epimerase